MFGVSGQYYGLSYGCNFSNPACSGFVVRRLYYKTKGVVEEIGYNLEANLWSRVYINNILLRQFLILLLV